MLFASMSFWDDDIVKRVDCVCEEGFGMNVKLWSVACVIELRIGEMKKEGRGEEDERDETDEEREIGRIGKQEGGSNEERRIEECVREGRE